MLPGHAKEPCTEDDMMVAEWVEGLYRGMVTLQKAEGISRALEIWAAPEGGGVVCAEKAVV